MLGNYLPILLFMLVAVGIGVALPLAGYFLSPKRPYAAKLSPYECGFPAEKGARLPFDVRFYLVAILFILFDLETAFLVPFAVVLKQRSLLMILSMLVFFLLLLVGFVYEWKKGGLDWE